MNLLVGDGKQMYLMVHGWISWEYVAGILLLPLTRHQAGHLNDCLKLK